jgi:hypothetical protein
VSSSAPRSPGPRLGGKGIIDDPNRFQNIVIGDDERGRQSEDLIAGGPYKKSSLGELTTQDNRIERQLQPPEQSAPSNLENQVGVTIPEALQTLREG